MCQAQSKLLGISKIQSLQNTYSLTGIRTRKQTVTTCKYQQAVTVSHINDTVTRSRRLRET